MIQPRLPARGAAAQEREARRPIVPLTVVAGLGLALATAAISGLSIYVNAFAVKQLPDATLYTTLKNGVAAVILVGVLLAAGGRADVRALDRRAWVRLATIGVVGGGIPFILFFSGLARASAPTAAFIQKTLFVWVALLAVPLLGERLGWVQIAALGTLFAGQFLIAPPTGVRWGSGETLIAVATLFWAVESILAKRLLREVPPMVVGAGRMAIGLVVLVGYDAVTGRLSGIAGLNGTQWAWALGTGVLLSGYVATWFGALRRAPASMVTSVLVVGAIITAALNAASNGAVPKVPVAAGYLLVILGAAVVAAAAVRFGRIAARSEALRVPERS
jgi:drug/metabolite transporter (DMT)-like permease